ncbi:thiamine phosphate synthase [Paenibacillus sp. N1-5-1-14]|uniref:thiamine phosphate synthase n=1 Tax=Paenibacillus radicibacter TaxID=2972488 RepID=UPI002159371B|nr:thiamine phosphate synthase [Paenibacillus radicibacter]MCR8644975.1 thiamine phosphate synthase [Paenibacillus radicibacter]
MHRDQLKLYLIFGSCNVRTDPCKVLDDAIRGGVTIFQYREKGSNALTGSAKYHLGKELQALCKKHQIPFIVNDDVELAMQLDADGIHIGQEDVAITEIKELFHPINHLPRKIIGVSAHQVAEAVHAIEHGADYLGVGPMYLTQTKKDAREVVGQSMIKEIRKHGITLPLVGIGGIDTYNALPVIEAGADGVAVISAISQSQDPMHSAQQFIQLIQPILNISEV